MEGQSRTKEETRTAAPLKVRTQHCIFLSKRLREYRSLWPPVRVLRNSSEINMHFRVLQCVPKFLRKVKYPFSQLYVDDPKTL